MVYMDDDLETTECSLQIIHLMKHIMIFVFKQCNIKTDLDNAAIAINIRYIGWLLDLQRKAVKMPADKKVTILSRLKRFSMGHSHVITGGAGKPVGRWSRTYNSQNLYTRGRMTRPKDARLTPSILPPPGLAPWGTPTGATPSGVASCEFLLGMCVCVCLCAVDSQRWCLFTTVGVTRQWSVARAL